MWRNSSSGDVMIIFTKSRGFGRQAVHYVYINTALLGAFKNKKAAEDYASKWMKAHPRG